MLIERRYKRIDWKHFLSNHQTRTSQTVKCNNYLLPLATCNPLNLINSTSSLQWISLGGEGFLKQSSEYRKRPALVVNLNMRVIWCEIRLTVNFHIGECESDDVSSESNRLCSATFTGFFNYWRNNSEYLKQYIVRVERTERTEILFGGGCSLR